MFSVMRVSELSSGTLEHVPVLFSRLSRSSVSHSELSATVTFICISFFPTLRLDSAIATVNTHVHSAKNYRSKKVRAGDEVRDLEFIRPFHLPTSVFFFGLLFVDCIWRVSVTGDGFSGIMKTCNLERSVLDQACSSPPPLPPPADVRAENLCKENVLFEPCFTKHHRFALPYPYFVSYCLQFSC